MILLRDAILYDPEPRGRVDVLLAGGRVLAVGPDLPPPPPGWPAEEVDCDRCLVVPGLLDIHAHLCGGGGEGGAHTRVPAVPLTAFTAAGVTTVVGLLGTDGTTRSLAGLLAAARALEHHGLTALCYTGAYEVPPPTLTGSVRGDIVHVDRFVAVGEVAISDHRGTQPTHDELVRLAADAHVAGMMTGKAGLLHLHLGDGPRGLAPVRRALDETELPPRTFHPTHVNRSARLWAEAQELAERGVTVDVTASGDDEPGVPSAAALAGWLSSGLDPARVTLSSDAGGALPEFDADGVLLRMGVGDSAGLLRTVAGAVARGAPLERALAAVTSNPARLYRLARKGRLLPGADADVAVLHPDLSVRDVLAGGRWMVRGGRAVARGDFEPG